MSEIFKAHAQYDDWVGTVAVDDEDQTSVRRWLENNNIIKNKEFLIGVEMYFNNTNRGNVSVKFLLLPVEHYELAYKVIKESEEFINVRAVHKNFEINDFMSLFKRFSVSFSSFDDLLKNKEYRDQNH